MVTVEVNGSLATLPIWSSSTTTALTIRFRLTQPSIWFVLGNADRTGDVRTTTYVVTGRLSVGQRTDYHSKLMGPMLEGEVDNDGIDHQRRSGCQTIKKYPPF